MMAGEPRMARIGEGFLGRLPPTGLPGGRGDHEGHGGAHGGTRRMTGRRWDNHNGHKEHKGWRGVAAPGRRRIEWLN